MSENYSLIFPKDICWDKFSSQRPRVPFSDSVIDFLNALSNSLMTDRSCRLYPDVITFAYFCRKANLLRLKSKYIRSDEIRLGRGVLFHIAPSNVPINFGYSLVAGLLAGNCNIVRISSKHFPQVDLIVKHLYDLLERDIYIDVAYYIALVRYDRMSDANAYFSSLANVRVIWGGDSTISNIRKNEIPPRSFDVCFADRYSISVINPKSIIEADDKEMKRLSEAFYNDTYLFDQNACSAPHTIFWINLPCLEQAKSRFWKAIHNYVSSKYQLQAVMSVDKLTAFYKQAVDIDIKKEDMPDNYIVRANLDELPSNIEEYRCACGYFSERTIQSLNEIAPIITIKYQTLGYYGFSKAELCVFVQNNRFLGLDRVVPIGETTSFSLTWDGYNLIDTFSRISSII